MATQLDHKMIMFENYKRIRKNPSKSNDWEAQHFKQSRTILKRNLFEGSFKRISSKSPIIPRHSTSKNLEQLLRCLKNPPEPSKKKSRKSSIIQRTLPKWRRVASKSSNDIKSLRDTTSIESMALFNSISSQDFIGRNHIGFRSIEITIRLTLLQLTIDC